MHGTPFSPGRAFPREQSRELSTPFSLAPDDIPIDPALSGPPLDPALLSEGVDARKTEVSPPPVLFPPPIPPPRQYSQGPQGDPFAPHVLSPYVPAEEPPLLSAKPAKKKRQPRREEECGFCQGNDSKNKYDQPEAMVSCAECGRSAHPACLDLADIGDIMRSYDWKCMECKNCEVCHSKEDDNRMMFCDFCDRGWHMDCLNPPLSETPPGKWHCPLCPPLSQFALPPDATLEVSSEMPPPPPGPTIRDSSVASTSRSAAEQPAMLVSAESEADVDIEGDGTPTATRSKKKTKRIRWKGSLPAREEPGQPEPEAGSTPAPTPAPKRMRLKISSPAPPPPPSLPPPKTIPVIRLRLPPRGKGKEREEDPEEAPKGLFDDILNPDDRNTNATSIVNGDKARFERSRAVAEQKLNPPPPLPAPEVLDTAVAGPSSRPLRSSVHHTPASAPTTMPTPTPSQSPAPSTPGPTTSKHGQELRIRKIRFGEYEIDTWYDAPFPEEYASIPEGRLWICEFCLKYMKSQFSASRHQMKCKMRHPPGDEIYRDGVISIFEVDGRKNKIYCQNLCLLSKMFLDHKSLFYDVEPFLFYVITETDDAGARFVGYFSKEKRSPKDYNVSCIMTLPVRQRQGWGNLLIDFSYLLSKKERRAGSPEKPLSALGALGYRNYWTLAIMRYLKIAPPDPRLEDISAATSMTIEDICNTLVHLDMIETDDESVRPKPLPGQSIRFPKGRKNGIARKHLQRTQTQDDDKVKGPFVPPTRYRIRWDPARVDEYMTRWAAKGYLTLKPEKLKWSPFVLTRTRQSERIADDADGDASRPDKQGGSSQTNGRAQAEVNGSHTSEASLSTKSESLTSVSNNKSSAFSLFDDENVETVTPTPQERPLAVLQGSFIVHSPSPEPQDEAQLQRDRALAEKLARDPPPSNRRLRSRAISSDSLFNGHSAPDRQTSGSSKSLPTPRTTKDGQHDGVNGGDDEMVLAAGASPEGQRPRAARSNSEHGKRAASRSMSPRKRRRVDSSPEVDVAPSSPDMRRTPRRPSRNQKSPSKSSRRSHIAQSKSLTNGDVSAGGDRESDAVQDAGEKISPADDVPMEVPQDVPAENEQEDRGREDRMDVLDSTASDGIISPLTPAQHSPLPLVDTSGPPEKLTFEDVETPLTAVGRHSIPSDDTIAVEEQLGASKVPPVGRAADTEDVPSAERHADTISAEDLGEEDAEGEEDVDAEGEPDLEMI
ncbi:hypothetical protein OBBRIDRAFT_831000 [Obba rivulosa]|uniref:Histone acetyltransferase n=1 Tax=Obba rivulosa TaxID=1052685 RepID=A0A8E2DTL1_9APHY|nr:hypothetical protein OBBRIDRAFT_831000 [Obba rivulosa]